ncbi:DUF805 domain-containing protein [Streptomyces sp. NPDC001985]|uniref:DUF805 domain-containing protein n=1 Tax=Streptomyces sp. NPDC001985 TaxID=3154406 RepID=UPI003320B7C4
MTTRSLGGAVHWYLDVLKKYATFRGRARRKEFWMFTLWATVTAIPLLALDIVLWEPPVLTVLYALAIGLPSLAVTVRRLHDIGLSGWWYLISFIPIAGPTVIFVFNLLDGQVNDNEFGPNPKYAHIV